jgi:hypothetical protein
LSAGGRVGGSFANREETKVVIVVRAFRLHEHSTWEGKRQAAETKHFLVEPSRVLGIPHVQDGVVESVNWHLAALLGELP